ncbi:MAG: hypothetical protein HQL23_07240 [Candidatus Omnitrophica bacterium]|nr:hypothetical protein [Candidatus Omnitrophota bacterium]
MFSNMIGALIFGAIGFVAFVYGKKNCRWPLMIIGAALMVYPYFVTNRVAFYCIGIMLTAALYFYKDA